MPNWIKIAVAADCPPGTGRELIVDDRVVALFHVEGAFYALDSVCPHQGGPLGQGALSGCIVTCPWHGWQFDVRTGQHQLSRRLQQPGYDVRLDGEEIFIDLDGRQPKA